MRIIIVNKLLSLAVALVVSATAAFAGVRELPATFINGRQYYYYLVGVGETVYSIANKLGVSRATIVEFNPVAADGVRKGSTLYFPVESFGAPVDTRDNTSVEAVSTEITHKVAKGETLFGISHRYGISPDDIVALNPEADGGVTTGMVLKIPSGKKPVRDMLSEPREYELYDTTPSATAQQPAAPVVQTPHAEAPVAQGDMPMPVDSVAAREVEPVDTVADEMSRNTVVLMLPLMAGSETATRQAELYTDFVRGALLAADTLSNRGEMVDICVLDTRGSIDEVRRLMADSVMSRAAVIVAPEDAAQLALVAESAPEGCYIFNLFNVKDTSYVVNPYMVQPNLPHKVMYAKAVETLLADFEGYTPVILSNTNGHNEKTAFIEFFRTRLAQSGITPVDIEFDGTLRAENLEALDPSVRYVIVPSSGTLAEFNRMSHALKTFSDSRIDGARVAVFGYPDWTTFRGDAADMLHALGAVIYSRFYADKSSLSMRNLDAAFTRWYGRSMTDVVPNQALLGFDVVNYIIRNLRLNEGEGFNPAYPSSYRGAQSSFDFVESSPGRGYYNSAIYIVNFMPGEYVSTRVK